MKNKTKVYLRADGNSATGLGHVHRLLALAEILSPHYDCKYVTKSPLPGVRELILKSGASIIEITENGTVQQEITEFQSLLNEKDIAILDGYTFDTAYQLQIKKKAGSVICIDDIHNHHFVCDVVINPSGDVDAGLYSLDPGTTLLTGPAYAFLKKSFREAATQRMNGVERKSLLICMGGADPDNHTLSVLKHCLRHKHDDYIIVIGEAYLHKEVLNKYIHGLKESVQVHCNINSDQMALLMQTSGAAVCSASSVAYEYLSIGGALYVLQTAENQKLLYNYIIKTGLGFSFLEFETTHQKIQLSIEKQRKIFDGQSGTRLLKVVNRLDFYQHVRVRKATEADILITFQWTNDPELRRQSYNENTISEEEHSRWFRGKLTDPKCFIFIFQYKNEPFALVRFDLSDEATISYSVDKNYRRKGWGQHVLRLAIENFSRQINTPMKIVGFVKKDNIASNIIFDNLGFTKQTTDRFQNSYKYEFIKS